MKNSEKEVAQVKQLLAALSELIFGRPLKKNTIEMFVEILLEDGITPQELLSAVKKWLLYEQTMPTPAHIRKVVKTGHTPSELEEKAVEITKTLLNGIDTIEEAVAPEVVSNAELSRIARAMGGWQKVIQKAKNGSLLTAVKHALASM